MVLLPTHLIFQSYMGALVDVPAKNMQSIRMPVSHMVPIQYNAPRAGNLLNLLLKFSCQQSPKYYNIYCLLE